MQSVDGTTWTAVGTAQTYVALSVSTLDITAASADGFITYNAGNKRYSVLTSTLITENASKFFRATVKAIWVDGTQSAASTISTITPDLVPVSNIQLVKGNPNPATLQSRATQHIQEGLLLSWRGHDKTTAKL